MHVYSISLANTYNSDNQFGCSTDRGRSEVSVSFDCLPLPVNIFAIYIMQNRSVLETLFEVSYDTEGRFFCFRADMYFCTLMYAQCFIMVKK